MIQQFTSKHTCPQNTFPHFYSSVVFDTPLNNSLEPHCFHTFAVVAAEEGSISYVVSDNYRSAAVPLAVSVAASGTLPPTGEFIAVGFSQYRPRSNPAPDFSAPLSIYPLPIQGVSRSFSIEHVFSVMPPVDAEQVLVTGTAFISFGGPAAVVSSVRAIFKDGPVYQPNK